MGEPKLPTTLIPHADQARAKADERLTKMIAALRCDINSGLDSTYLWYSIAEGFALNAGQDDCATALSTALMRLAVKPPGKARIRRCCPGTWIGVCPCCSFWYEGPHPRVVGWMDKHVRTGCRPTA